MSLFYYDAHNHLQDDWLDPHRIGVLNDCRDQGIRGMVVNGTCEQDWAKVSDIAVAFPFIVPSFGLHPWDAGNRSTGWHDLLRSQLEKDPAAAVGEIGIDRWIIARARPDDPRLLGLRRAPMEEQSAVFISQLALACSLRRPASIHCIDAWGTLLELLRSTSLPSRGFLLHAYAGPVDLVPSFVELGAMFSFNGSFLDPRKQRAKLAFEKVPLDRLLVETDAPAMLPPAEHAPFVLPPEPGGQRINHPANIVAIYAGLAALLALPPDELCQRCEENFLRLFGA